jgi:hypothetical protein
MVFDSSSDTMKTAIVTGTVVLLTFCITIAAVAAAPIRVVQRDDDPLDLKSIPISDWLNAGEHAEIPWNFRVSDPYLRVDQRIEVSYMAGIRGKDLNRSGKAHELFFVSRISSPDGEWLEEPSVSRPVDQDLSTNNQTQYFMRVSLQPGEYLLWVVLYDRQTGKHNLAKRRVRVSEFRGDPLPVLYRETPLVEFPEAEEPDQGLGYVKGHLYLPVHNKRPLQVNLISTLSPPEQWTGRARVLRTQNDVTVGAVAALSQMELAEGTLSIAGLDLVRREVLYDQTGVRGVDWPTFTGALKKAQTPAVSAKALQDSKNNSAFFREFLSQRIIGPAGGDASDENPMRIVIVVTSSQLFEHGSDLTPLQIEGDCRCRVYHLRFRLNTNDVFDEIEKIIKPLHPRTFNLTSPQDVRKAIAEIVNDLEKL